MTLEREWRQGLEFLISKLEDERRADAKAFYNPPANPLVEQNGNARARFLAETMRLLLPRVEQLMRS